jgi:imidazole glycerol-phosphate synthase subunit HisH
MIAIVDYGMGNLGSLSNMLKYIGASAMIAKSVEEVASADKLVLPGVGAFETGMLRLEASGLIPILRRRVLDEHVPVLGICLGMQLMTQSSDEGQRQGLGWVAAKTRRFAIPPGSPCRVPHMGWNHVTFRSDCPLAKGLSGEPRFYFVHSYHAVLVDEEADWMARTTYGYPFVSGFSHHNIYGVQFHPEKSHAFGMQLFRNFAGLS